MYRGKVGLGVTTWKRPGLYAECFSSVLEHVGDLVDVGIVIQNGEPLYVSGLPAPWVLRHHPENQGWAPSKNGCLDYLLAEGCDHLFMIEDDTLVTDRRAVTGYVDAALASGLHYFTAHPWGETTTALVATDGPVSFWAYVGSWWTYMTRHGYETGGGYNLTLGDTMGDIELPQRWRLLGLTSGWGRIPDATGSEAWVKPRCMTVDQSTIASQPGWVEKQAAALAWWVENMPETVPTEIRPANEGRKSRRCLPANP